MKAKVIGGRIIMTDEEFGKLIANIFEGLEVQEKVSDGLSNEISRNSEILQSHREEIDDMRKDIDLLLKEKFNEQPIKPFKEMVPQATGIDYAGDNISVTKLYSIAAEGYDNKLNHLKELFEKLININDQAFACGAMTAREYSRVTKVRKEYQELMEG